MEKRGVGELSAVIVPGAKQLAEEVYCSSDFGLVGAPDLSPAIEVGLIPGFSPGALFQGSPIFMR